MCRNSPKSTGSKTDGNGNKKRSLKNICYVYKEMSKKLLGHGSQDQVCEGQCQQVEASNRQNFLCKCLPKIKCLKRCAKNTKFKESAQEVHANTEQEGKCKCGLQWKRIEVKDQIDQTGEPAFVVQVRRGGQEIVNLVEVQDNVRKLGKSRIPCTCPTFNRHLQHSIKHVCPSGSCRKALNSKSVSINCKCVSRKFRVCTDDTCILKEQKALTRFNRIMDPLFSMNVNTDRNTILNFSEIQKLIGNCRNKICKTGRCRDSFNKGEIDFTCECPHISDYCTDETCNSCMCIKNMNK